MMNCIRSLPLCLLVTLGVWAGAYADLPRVEVIEPDARMHPGEPAVLTYRLSWPVEGEQWRVPAPELVDQPEWGQIQLQSASTYVVEDQVIAEFAIGVIAADTGHFELPSLEFEVFSPKDIPKNEQAPLKKEPAVWETSQAVTSEPITVAVVPDYREWIPVVAAGGGAAVLLLAVGWAVFRGRPQPVGEAVPVSDDPREHVHAARKHRLDGDFYHFFLALGSAAGKGKGAEAVKLATQHNERAREVGYGGIRPTDDEMDAALKDTERLIAAPRG